MFRGRPWATPSAPWVLFMRWLDLAFLHWPLPPEALRRHVPAELQLDLYDGSAWLGVTPFVMSGVRPRFTPPVPILSSFPELNVRTYVSVEGKPGVWFLSLDAGSALAVEAARRGYGLPYHRASMDVGRADGEIDFRSARKGRREDTARFHARYRPIGPAHRADPATSRNSATSGDPASPGRLERWLTERYCLYSRMGGRLYRADIHHAPWPLRPAEAEIRTNSMTSPAGIELPEVPPLTHYAARLDVFAWLPHRVKAPTPGH